MDSPHLKAIWKNLAESTGRESPPRPLEKLARRPQRGFPAWSILSDQASTVTIPMPSAENRSSKFRLVQTYQLAQFKDAQSFNSLLLEDLAADISCVSIDSHESTKDLNAPEMLKELCRNFDDFETCQNPSLAGVYPTLLHFEFPVETTKLAPSFRQAPQNLWTLFDADSYSSLSDNIPHLDNRPVVFRLSAFHARGASASTELALMLATTAHIERTGIRVGACEWRFSVSSALLGSIAKLRAARLLLALAETQRPSLIPNQKIGSETSLVELSHIDTWSNLIRNTIGVAAAFIGGAETLLVHSHDKLVARPNSFGHRLARNIAHLASQESHLNAFDDPVAGSFALEQQTKALAEAAWNLFLKIEASGGLEKDLQKNDGLIEQQIRHDRDELILAERHRRPGLIGVSEYPDLNGLSNLMNHECPESLFTQHNKISLPDPFNWKKPLFLSALFGGLRDRLSLAAYGIPAAQGQDRIYPYRMKIEGESSLLTARIAWTENALAAGGLFRDDNTEGTCIEIFIGSDESYEKNLCIWLSSCLPGTIPLVAGKLSPSLHSLAQASGLFESLYVGSDLYGQIERIISALGSKR